MCVEKKKLILNYNNVVGAFFCFAGLPHAVLLLYWAELFPTVLGPSVLNKRVETGPTETQIGSACAQIRLRLSGACLW